MRGRTWVWVVGILGLGLVTSMARAESRPTKDTKGGGVSFRLANSGPVSGYEKMEAGGSTVYVAPRPVWTGSDVVSAQTREGTGLELALTPEAAQRLTNLGAGDRVAVFMDGKVSSVGELSATGGRVTIKGLNAGSVERIVRALNGVQPAPNPTPVSALITLVPTGTQDGAYMVDVYLQGVANLRTYQIGLIVDGGTAGDLVREEARIEQTREDFVFGELDAIVAADQVGGRLAGVLKDGAVDRPDAAYLGTYEFRPTLDAAGSFQISIDTGEKSFLADGGNERMEFATGPAAVINVGGAPVRRASDK